MNRSILTKVLILIIMTMTGCNNISKTDAVLDNIHARKSVRQFTSEEVSPEQIEIMLKAAMAAPSAVNQQPWRFIVVTGRQNLDHLSEGLPYAKMLKQATLAVVVCGETTWNNGKDNPYWSQDCSAATQNLLLAAEALGLGAVWTAVYPDEDRVEWVVRTLEIPEGVLPLCVVPIGHPAGENQPRDKWKPENIHYGKWGSGAPSNR